MSASAPLTDRWAVALGASAAAGAWWSAPPSVWLLVGAPAAALLWRRPALVCLACLVVVAALGARAEAGLRVASGPWQGSVTLVTDPVAQFGSVRAEVRAGGHHLELLAAGPVADALRSAAAGDRFTVEGAVSPLRPAEAYLRWRHVAGQLRADTLRPAGAAAWPWRLATRVRSLIESSAAALPDQQRALFDGFVLGDARGQSTEVASDFRASGLTHLLVVSGENVALLLAVVAPLLRRCRLGPRLAVTLLLLLFFALVTRFEPSVLRASVMAAIAATGVALGRPAEARRSLALAVAALVLVDPFLVHSIGFALSVGASAGIIALAGPLTGALPGPRAVARPAAVTLAAQVGVAPLLVTAFGGLPVATVPANVLAAPAAAWVAIWGLPAGLSGAALGGGVASLLVAPTGWLLGWVGGVARVSAGLPLGRLGTGGAAALSLGVVVLALGHSRSSVPVWRWLGRVGGALAVGALVWPGLALRLTPPTGPLDGGIVLHRGGGASVAVVSSRASLGRALDSLAAAGVRRLDLVTVPRGGPADGAFVAGLRHRIRVGRVLGPPGEQVRGGTAAEPGQRWRVGGLVVAVRSTAPRLSVTVGPIAAGQAQAMPLHWTGTARGVHAPSSEPARTGRLPDGGRGPPG